MLKQILAPSVLISVSLFIQTATGATNSATVIKAGHLVDTVGGSVLVDQMILIEGENIKEVGANLKIPDTAKVIDLSSAWVLPGLIDCHTQQIPFVMKDGIVYKNQLAGSEQKQAASGDK